MTLHHLPGIIPARNALSDVKTHPEIRNAAQRLIDAATHGADEQPYAAPVLYRCLPVRPSTVELFSAAGTAAVIFAAGWVAGLLTIIATLPGAQ